MRIAAFLLGSVLLAQSTLAADGQHEIRIGPRIGPGEIRIDGNKALTRPIVSTTVEEDTAGLGGTVEYSAPFGLVVEVGHFATGESDWWDDDKLVMTDTFASIGWQIEIGNGFSVTPRVGRSRWKIEDDASVFDDDDDELNPKIRGYQNYWELSAAKRLTSVVTLGVSHKDNSYDFGHSRSTMFTVMFNLR
jgi:hypothetical protein